MTTTTTITNAIVKTKTIKTTFDPPVKTKRSAIHSMKIEFSEYDEDGEISESINVTSAGRTLTVKGKEDMRERVGYVSIHEFQEYAVAALILSQEGLYDLAKKYAGKAAAFAEYNYDFVKREETIEDYVKNLIRQSLEPFTAQGLAALPDWLQ